MDREAAGAGAGDGAAAEAEGPGPAAAAAAAAEAAACTALRTPGATFCSEPSLRAMVGGCEGSVTWVVWFLCGSWGGPGLCSRHTPGGRGGEGGPQAEVHLHHPSCSFQPRPMGHTHEDDMLATRPLGTRANASVPKTTTGKPEPHTSCHSRGRHVGDEAPGLLRARPWPCCPCPCAMPRGQQQRQEGGGNCQRAGHVGAGNCR